MDDKPKAQAFESYLAAHPGAIDLWLGGHTHTHPDDVLNGRSHVERKWGVNFVNCAQLSKFHSYVTCPPMSRHFTFTEGSRLVRVRCYLHDDTHAAQGWYPNASAFSNCRNHFIEAKYPRRPYALRELVRRPVAGKHVAGNVPGFAGSASYGAREING